MFKIFHRFLRGFSKWNQLSNIIIYCLINSSSSVAQIIPDHSLGDERSVIKQAHIKGVISDVIEGGASRGNNLFHSFQQFNVGEGKGAYFANPGVIENIFSRVTGGNISNLKGVLGVLGNANLFFINPNGIVFGPNAKLDLKGSFINSTAESIVFNNFEFSASNPQQVPLLSINIPVGLKLRENPNSIRVESHGELLTIPVGKELQPGLEVSPGKTLALIGGNLEIDGGVLLAPGGKIELGGLATEGIVNIKSNLNFSFPDGIKWSNLAISNGADLRVWSDKGGEININVNNLTISGHKESPTRILAGIEINKGTKENKAGDVVINGKEQITLDATNGVVRVFNLVGENGRGNAGNININTELLVIKNGASINAQTFGSGNGGNIIINGNTIRLEGANQRGEASTVASGVGTEIFKGEITGNAGKIEINTNILEVLNGAVIEAATRSKGNAGNIIINATDRVIIDGERIQNGLIQPSLISTAIRPGATGNAGNIQINARGVELINGGRISSDTYGEKNGGRVIINGTDKVVLEGKQSEINPQSSLITRTWNVGNAGEIIIKTSLLEVKNRASIEASTLLESTGNGGNIIFEIQEGNITNEAKITVNSQGKGDGGSININSGKITLNNNAEISAATASGEGGNINLELSDIMILKNKSFITTTAEGTGNGGDITMLADFLILLENSNITANAFLGKGGNINLTAQGIFFDDSSQITATSELGVDGVVETNTPDNDPAGGLIDLQQNVVNAEDILARDFCKLSKNSSFYIVGTGGLPPNPHDTLELDDVTVNWVQPALNSTENNGFILPNLNPTSSRKIVPARGWIFNEKGEVVLVSYDPTLTQPQRQKYIINCQGN